MPIGAFLAAFLVLIPLPSHWKARNIATTSMIVWLFVVNIILGVNTIAWENDAVVRMVTWCDIGEYYHANHVWTGLRGTNSGTVTRIDIGSNVALPAACFCLSMHLERVASVRMARITYEDKRRRMLVDLALCFGVPIVYMGLCMFTISMVWNASELLSSARLYCSRSSLRHRPRFWMPSGNIRLCSRALPDAISTHAILSWNPHTFRYVFQILFIPQNLILSLDSHVLPSFPETPRFFRDAHQRQIWQFRTDTWAILPSYGVGPRRDFLEPLRHHF